MGSEKCALSHADLPHFRVYLQAWGAWADTEDGSSSQYMPYVNPSRGPCTSFWVCQRSTRSADVLRLVCLEEGFRVRCRLHEKELLM